MELKKKLFDISLCKCPDFKKCLCLNKVPSKEQAFLVDQRRERKMVIAGVDIVTTRSLERRVARISQIEQRKNKAYSTVAFPSIN